MTLLSASESRRPPGISFLENQLGIRFTLKQYKFIVIIFTYLVYAIYHATRKVPSIVKSDLNPITSNLGQWQRAFFLKNLGMGAANSTMSKGWAPFNGPDGNTLLGAIDVAFLLTYSVGMFFAGHVGDRMDLRIFLTIGMLGTAIFTALFGAGYWLNIHNFVYFLVIQMFGGLLQSTGWPSVMGIVGKWFSKKKRGLIMGFWSSHTSVGNIGGSLLASALLKSGWGWSFAAPGILMAVAALGVFLFLPPIPESVGAQKISKTEQNDNTDPLLGQITKDAEKAVGFLEACLIPGVMQFSICLFFAKLVTYTFLYWLPFYISHTAIGGHFLSDAESGSLSTVFDVGGIIGGILAGIIYDRSQAGAITSASFMICTIPALLFYRVYGTISLFWNITLMFIAGLLANAPYALVTTAVTTHLGTHGSLKGNSQALATVAAIVDGTGSLGSAIGPLLTGYLSTYSWDYVFIMLMLSAAIGALVLVQPIVEEIKEIRSSTRSQVADVRAGIDSTV